MLTERELQDWFDSITPKNVPGTILESPGPLYLIVASVYDHVLSNPRPPHHLVVEKDRSVACYMSSTRLYWSTWR